MHDGFEPLEFAGLGQEGSGELLAIDLAVCGRAGKCRLDRGNGGSLVEPVYLRIRIADGNAECAQPAGHRGLAHADGAGEADDEHQRPSMSATIRARSSGVTSGVTPNHLAKPGTAWCSSMPRPSMAESPRSRAAATSGVTSGT